MKLVVSNTSDYEDDECDNEPEVDVKIKCWEII